MPMTPRGRAALVLGLVLVVAAFVGGTVEVRVGAHGCGSAVSAHAPAGRGARQARLEDECDSKITNRRVLVGFVGIAGVGLAMWGAFDHKRPRGGRVSRPA